MMNESMEERLRRHLHSIDGAPVRDAQSVSAAAERIARRLRRRRRALATVSSVVLVVLASVALWTSRAHAPSVAPAVTDTRSSTTQVAPTTSAPPGPTTTLTPPASTAPVVNTPSSYPPVLIGAHQVVDMSFVDAQLGWLLEGDDSSTTVLLATSDGGATWKASSVDTRQATHVKFADQMNGWMYGGGNSSFQSTHDGGATWQSVDLAGAGMIDGVQVLASDGNTVTIVSGIAAADQNVNWTAAMSPVDADNFARIGIDFHQGAGPANDWSIATSGGDTWLVYNDRVVTGTGRTLNGVATPWTPPWTELFGPASVTATGNGGPLYALVTAFAWNGVAENQLYVSEDRGDTFRQLTPPPGIAEFPPSWLVVADQSTVVISVAQSDGSEALYRSSDKGSTWQVLASFSSGQGVENVTFADATTAYATSQPNPDGQPARLMKSVDAGATWQPITIP